MQFESQDKTNFLRLSWSPDGQYLVTPNARNSGEPTAGIIEINGRPIKNDGDALSCEMDFVGHLKEVTCVRFNSALFKKPGVKTKHCVLATGSRDNTVAVWSTVQRNPIVVVRNLFSKSVEDLAWGPNGLILVACSTDGTVGVMVFKELGQVVSVEDQVTTLQSMYGKSYIPQYLHSADGLPVNGEKFETLVGNEGDIQMPSGANEANIKDSNTIETNKHNTLGDEASKPAEVHAKQIETRLADGKRRITPITLSLTGLGAQSFSSSSDSKTKIIVERREISNTPQLSSSGDEMDRSLRKRKEPQSPTQPAKMRKTVLIPIKLPDTEEIVPQPLKQRIVPPNAPILSPLKLPDAIIEPIPLLRDSFIETFNNKSKKRFVVRNMTKVDEYPQVKWQISFGSRIVAVRTTELWTVIVEAAKVLHVVSTETGRNYHCPIFIPYLPAHLVLTPSQYLCIINTLGHITVRNLTRNQGFVENEELRFHLTTSDGDILYVLSCEISSDGTPIIVLSNGCTLTFCHDTGWVLLSDVLSSKWRVAANHPLLKKVLSKLEETMLLGAIISESQWVTKYSSAEINSIETPMEMCSTNALINLILSAEKLQSPTEYKMIVLELARFFAENVNKTELENLLKSLDFGELRKKDEELLREMEELLASCPQQMASNHT